MRYLTVAIAIFLAELGLNFPLPTPGVIASAMDLITVEQTAYYETSKPEQATMYGYEMDGAERKLWEFERER